MKPKPWTWIDDREHRVLALEERVFLVVTTGGSIDDNSSAVRKPAVEALHRSSASYG